MVWVLLVVFADRHFILILLVLMHLSCSLGAFDSNRLPLFYILEDPLVGSYSCVLSCTNLLCMYL